MDGNIDNLVDQLNSNISVSATTVDDQKRYICKHANSLDHEKKMQIGSLIDRHGYRGAIVKYNDGTSIDLDVIDSELLINTIYNIVYYDVKLRG